MHSSPCMILAIQVEVRFGCDPGRHQDTAVRSAVGAERKPTFEVVGFRSWPISVISTLPPWSPEFSPGGSERDIGPHEQHDWAYRCFMNALGDLVIFCRR
jgi:hypothetical protein